MRCDIAPRPRKTEPTQELLLWITAGLYLRFSFSRALDNDRAGSEHGIQQIIPFTPLEMSFSHFFTPAAAMNINSHLQPGNPILKAQSFRI